MKIPHSSTIDDPDFLSIIYPEEHVKLPFGSFIASVKDLIAVGEVMSNCLVQKSNIEKYTKNILKNKWNLYYLKEEGETCLFSVNKKLRLLEAEAPPPIPYDLFSKDYSFFDQPTPENNLCKTVAKKIKKIQETIKDSRIIYRKLAPQEQLLFIYKHGYIIKMLPVDYSIFTSKSLKQLPDKIAQKIIKHVLFGLTGSHVKPKVYDRMYKNLQQLSSR